jgi:hypothetical protein
MIAYHFPPPLFQWKTSLPANSALTRADHAIHIVGSVEGEV